MSKLVKIDLSNLYEDHKRSSIILIDDRFKTISDLEKFLKDGLNIAEPFYLEASGMWLPSFESPAILHALSDEIRLKVVKTENSVEKPKKKKKRGNEICENSTEDEEVIRNKKKKKKNKERNSGTECIEHFETPVPQDETTVLPDESPVTTDETPVPLDETPVPPDETPVPPDETPVPTDETPVPTDETPVPTDETPVPTDETPVPPDETSLPPDETPELLLSTSVTPSSTISQSYSMEITESVGADLSFETKETKKRKRFRTRRKKNKKDEEGTEFSADLSKAKQQAMVILDRRFGFSVNYQEVVALKRSHIRFDDNHDNEELASTQSTVELVKSPRTSTSTECSVSSIKSKSTRYKVPCFERKPLNIEGGARTMDKQESNVKVCNGNEMDSCMNETGNDVLRKVECKQTENEEESKKINCENGEDKNDEKVDGEEEMIRKCDNSENNAKKVKLMDVGENKTGSTMKEICVEMKNGGKGRLMDEELSCEDEKDNGFCDEQFSSEDKRFATYCTASPAVEKLITVPKAPKKYPAPKLSKPESVLPEPKLVFTEGDVISFQTLYLDKCSMPVVTDEIVGRVVTVGEEIAVKVVSGVVILGSHSKRFSTDENEGIKCYAPGDTVCLSREDIVNPKKLECSQ